MNMLIIIYLSFYPWHSQDAIGDCLVSIVDLFIYLASVCRSYPWCICGEDQQVGTPSHWYRSWLSRNTSKITSRVVHSTNHTPLKLICYLVRCCVISRREIGTPKFPALILKNLKNDEISLKFGIQVVKLTSTEKGCRFGFDRQIKTLHQRRFLRRTWI